MDPFLIHFVSFPNKSKLDVFLACMKQEEEEEDVE